MKHTNLLQRPGGMEGCDIITSRQHFEEGVPVLTGKKKKKKMTFLPAVNFTSVISAEAFVQILIKQRELRCTYFPPGCVKTLLTFSSDPAWLSLTSTPAGPRRWLLLRT